MSTPETKPESSPQWSATTKLVVGLTFVAIIAALVVRFNNIIGPLLLAFILAYVFHPLAVRLSGASGLSWRGSVNLIYLILIVLIIVFLTVTGVAVVQQLQSLVRVVQRFVTDLPALAQELSTQVITLGPFGELDVSQIVSQYNLDLLSAADQAISVLQPVLGQAGGLLGEIATSALVTLGWGAFVLIVSYFILADAGQVPDLLKGVEIPGHHEDIRRLGRKLGRVWNAFLRGQLALFVMVFVLSFLLLTILGVRNALGLAFLVGLAKFVPYVGPVVAEITAALVAFFQSGNYLGLQPLTFAIVVVVATLILDQIFDNLVTPRIFGQTLGVHPAAVLVAAIIAANLIGFVGLLLAAPVLASLQLFGRYAMRKMLDLDPWPEPQAEAPEYRFPFARQFSRLLDWLRKLRTRGQNDDK